MATVTAAQVNESLETLVGKYADLKKRFGSLVKVNARNADKVKSLDTKVRHLAERFEKFGGLAGKAQLAAFGQEVERLQGMVNAAFSDLQQQHDALREQVDDHAVRICDLQEAQTGIVGELELHARAFAAVASWAGRISPVAWVLGVIAGIIAGILWANHNWSQHATLNGIKVTVENTAANSWWAVALAGISAGLFVLFVVACFVSTPDDVRAAAESSAMAGLRRGAGGNQPPAPPTNVQTAPGEQPDGGGESGNNDEPTLIVPVSPTNGNGATPSPEPSATPPSAEGTLVGAAAAAGATVRTQ